MAMERSKRQAGTSYASSDAFQTFLRRLRDSDKNLGEAEGRVLRLKQFLPSDVGPKIMDSIIDALALNTNVEALYIQNFEKGMDDERLAHLVQVLKQRQIWALNIGENFQITHYAWGLFLEELPLTAVSYLYVSEHHLKGTKLKDQMRDAIRLNRNAGGQRDVTVIKKITNMWYNPKTPEQLEVARKRREEREKERLELEKIEKEKAKKGQKQKKKKKTLHNIKKKSKGYKGKKSKGYKGKKPTRNLIGLNELVNWNHIELGAKLRYEYQDYNYFGILSRDERGDIEIRPMDGDKNKYPCRVWKSPSQFGINCIRVTFPSRQAVNGWDDLYCGDQNLGELRRDLNSKAFKDGKKLKSVKTLMLNAQMS